MLTIKTKLVKRQQIPFFFIFIFLLAFNGSAQNVLKIGTGTTLKTTGGTVLTLSNMNLDNDGTINQSPGEGTFRFTGTQNNSISGINLPVIDRIEIAKNAGASVSLNRNINIVSGINFNSGLLDLNNHSIFLLPAALLNNESEISRVIGPGGGFIEITNTLNGPSSQNPGNLGAVISSSQNLGSTIIRRGHQPQPGVGSGNSVSRYYEIIPASNSGLNATLRFHYFDAELNSLDENAVVMWKSYGNFLWTNMGYSSRNTAANYVEKTNINDFSRWTLSSGYNARLVNNQQNKPISAQHDNAKDLWKAWPNPVNNVLYLTVVASGQSTAVVRISDSKGNLIKQDEYHLSAGINQLTIDMKKLPAGVYHLLATCDDGKTTKLIPVIKL